MSKHDKRFHAVMTAAAALATARAGHAGSSAKPGRGAVSRRFELQAALRNWLASVATELDEVRGDPAALTERLDRHRRQLAAALAIMAGVLWLQKDVPAWMTETEDIGDGFLGKLLTATAERIAALMPPAKENRGEGMVRVGLIVLVAGESFFLTALAKEVRRLNDIIGRLNAS